MVNGRPGINLDSDNLIPQSLKGEIQEPRMMSVKSPFRPWLKVKFTFGLYTVTSAVWARLGLPSGKSNIHPGLLIAGHPLECFVSPNLEQILIF